jgi:hypothetical protein
MNNKSLNNRLSFVQINIQRSKNSTTQLLNYIKDNKIDIALIQEPYTLQSKICGFPLSAKL